MSMTEYVVGGIQLFTKKVRGLPFYNFQNVEDIETFNHVLGFPQKNGQSYPMFDYEKLVLDVLQKHKHVWIKKLPDWALLS